MSPRAVFAGATNRAGAAVISPLTSGGSDPLLPLLSAQPWPCGFKTWGESGTETHIPIAESPHVIESEGKKARAAAIIVIAAAQRQPLQFRITPHDSP